MQASFHLCKRAAYGVLLLYLVLLPGHSLVLAQQVKEPAPSEPALAVESEKKHTVLVSLLQAIAHLEAELKAKQDELRSPGAEGRQEELTQQIQQISDKLKALRENFIEYAAEVDLGIFVERKETAIDWSKELKDFLEPVMSELRRLTERPREIERLRLAISRYKAQYPVVTKALANLTKLQQSNPEPALQAYLLQVQREWERRQQELQTQMSIAVQQLEQKLGERQTLAESLQSLFQLFFRSRGRNVLLAFLAFVLFWFGANRLHSWFRSLSPWHHRERSFFVRVFTLGYMLLTVLGSILASQMTLYLLGDWVLLTLSSVFLIGIVWTSKHALPHFWKQTMLLLNLGAVREGERLVYNGVPWLVRTLHFYTHLVNPELVGGDIRLPLRELMTLHSRPFTPEEPWFPTRDNDWVLLADQTFGKVVLQTPEVVRLVLLGGSRKTFSAPDFMAQNPVVLSTGFRLEVSFGVDYRHQAEVTQTIPTRLEAKLRVDLAQESYERDLVRVRVEFEEAGASALALRVLADCAGAMAPDYMALRRTMQRICVDACNAYGWVIPFTQLTLHMATPVQHEVPENLVAPTP